MDYPVISPKKLIEVALPINVINDSCVKEKNPFLKGHPRAVHLWWARRPLAAARSVLFAQLVNDPSWKWDLEHHGEIPPSHLKASWAASRKRLFSILEDLVQWENTNNESVLEKARTEIHKSWIETCDINKDHPDASTMFNPLVVPGLHDPFAGGGAIPLEAQRLGLSAFASDLNPVAVLINKAMIEIPALFANAAPVAKPKGKNRKLIENEWSGTAGLAEDIRRYAEWMREEANLRTGNLYPPLIVTASMAENRPDLSPFVGKSLTVIAWLWVRTAKSPNPAFSHIDVPLTSTFTLSNKKNKEAYVVPVVNKNGYHFQVKLGISTPEVKSGTTSGKRSGFICVMSGTPIDYKYVRSEGKAGRLGQKLMAVVAETPNGKVYISPTPEIETAAMQAQESWRPEIETCGKSRVNIGLYGLTKWGDLFTKRQLAVLNTLSDLVHEARSMVYKVALERGMSNDDTTLEQGGSGAKAYADAICIYLACGISQLLRYSCLSCAWNRTNENIVQAFGRQAFPMIWDFAEAHMLSGSLSIEKTIGWVASAIETLPVSPRGLAIQADAQTQTIGNLKIVSTDPPYYDNIAYADLSDFFYVWLRKSLQSIYPSLFATMTVPKNEELVATPYRHVSKDAAESFFLSGMTEAMQRLEKQSHPSFPLTIYYAFKQSETDSTSTTVSTGWETFLSAVVSANLQLTGTWPMRTEKVDALKKSSNVLASSIVLVCRKRALDAPVTSRREFLRELNQVLPEALDEMTRGTSDEHAQVAPVDLSQAIIGPGMAVFSKYSAVLEADGSPMSVRTALQLINRFLAEDDFDADTQFCLHWFEQHGWEAGKFGEADTLARAKGTSVDGVKHAGVLHAASGSVRLLKWVEFPENWDAQSDQRLPIWEALHQLIRVFNTEGETGAAEVFAAVQSKAEAARQLAYRLYTLCERKNWAEDARAYNEVVTSWSGIEAAAAKEPSLIQRELFDN
jgi:putative DNA methylase